MRVKIKSQKYRLHSLGEKGNLRAVTVAPVHGPAILSTSAGATISFYDSPVLRLGSLLREPFELDPFLIKEAVFFTLKEINFFVLLHCISRLFPCGQCGRRKFLLLCLGLQVRFFHCNFLLMSFLQA